MGKSVKMQIFNLASVPYVKKHNNISSGAVKTQAMLMQDQHLYQGPAIDIYLCVARDH